MALELVERSAAALAAAPHPANTALRHWCQLLLAALRPAPSAAARLEALRRLGTAEEVREREVASRQTAALNASLLASLKASLDRVGGEYLPAGMMPSYPLDGMDSDDDSLD